MGHVPSPLMRERQGKGDGVDVGSHLTTSVLVYEGLIGDITAFKVVAWRDAGLMQESDGIHRARICFQAI